MVLLHALHFGNQENAQTQGAQATDKRADTQPWRLIVAHLDHGMREDSAKDRQLVQDVARQLDLPFVYHEARLGVGTSEAAARRARYDFLQRVRGVSGARAIVTAHHQDDVLETAIINLLRGSGRKGLTSLDNRAGMERPLLHMPKRDLVAYAKDQGLQWREDSTNTDLRYLRNYVRHRLLPRFDESARQRLGKIIHNLRATNDQLDSSLINQLHLQSITGRLDRVWFNQLPHTVAREVMATWLRVHGHREFDTKTLERLVVAAKVAPAGRKFNVSQGVMLVVCNEYLALTGVER